MKNLALLLFFLSVSSYAGSNLGLWGTTCDDDGFIFHFSEKSTPLIINDNQIVISIHAKENADNIINVFFDRTLDLGRGGMNFNWKSVSSTMKVAEMKVINRTGFFTWNGFFDNRKKKYFWVKNPDFVKTYAENGVITLHKCK